MGYERPVAGELAVVSTPGILGGMPCVAGTRVPAETIRQYLLAGEGKRQVYSDYPSLPPGAVEAVVRWAEGSGLACSSS